MIIKRSDVISTAVKFEKEGEAFYLDAASKTENSAARKMFQSFAADERKHVEWLEKLAADEAVVISDPKELRDGLKAIFAATTKDKNDSKASRSEITAIRVAIGKEVESTLAYTAWANEMSDATCGDICRKLAKIEDKHRQLLENMLQYLEKTGDWFMQEEQWIFEG